MHVLENQASVREVKRLDSISRSPVYSSLGEALAGLPTIRAFRAEQRLAKRNAALVNKSVVMSLANMSMNRCVFQVPCCSRLSACSWMGAPGQRTRCLSTTPHHIACQHLLEAAPPQKLAQGCIAVPGG